MSLQNGLGHEDILADIVGRERVLAGKTYAGGTELAPGHVNMGTRGKDTHIGELDGCMSERVRHIAATFTAAGLETTVSDNIMGTLWDKLLVNVATGALNGACPRPTSRPPPNETVMTYSHKSYVEHVALRVKDIQWHIKFFYEVPGMDVREIDGPVDAPNQWSGRHAGRAGGGSL